LFSCSSPYAFHLLEGIPGPASALRQVPDDVFKRTFEIAGFAVETIAEIHPYRIMFQFIDPGRAEYGAGRSIIGNTRFAY
jgi:hypothetical protein